MSFVNGSSTRSDPTSSARPGGSGPTPASPPTTMANHWGEPDIEAQVERQFAKLFHFQCANTPDPASSIWASQADPPDLEPNPKRAARFMALRERLNEVKSRLNALPLGPWHAHTRQCNPANLVVRHLRLWDHPPELLTQAWCKMSEILNRFELVPPGTARYHSAHLCEAPGAFIAALNHHLRTRAAGEPVDWRWRASTLNPYYEANPTSHMINDDRFILETLENWDFGADGTGDILDVDNRSQWTRAWRQALDERVDLVTADGSIDCQMDPGGQESLVAPLHQAETALALSLLSPGGAFVLKMFTFYEASSIGLLYLLTRTFGRLSVFKPATSKEGNSEVYVVAQDFHGHLSPDDQLALLREPTTKAPLYDLSTIPEAFVAEVYECAERFQQWQAQVIQRNLKCFRTRQRPPRIKELQVRVSERFRAECQLADALAPRFKLVQGRIGLASQCLNLDERLERGSFQERQHHRKCPSLAEIDQQIRAIRPPSGTPSGTQYHFVEWLQVWETLDRHRKVEPVYAKAFQNVLSSKFCSSDVLNIYYATQDFVAARLSEANPEKRRRKVPPVTSSTLGEEVANDPTLRQILEWYPYVDANTRVMVFSHEFHAGTRCFHAESLATLRQLLAALAEGEHLVLKSFMGLTQLDVSILLMVSDCFQEIGFVRPRSNNYSIFLSARGSQADLDMVLARLDRIQECMAQVPSPDYSLLAVCGIRDLLHKPMYPQMVAYNMLALREKSLHLLNTIRPKTGAADPKSKRGHADLQSKVDPPSSSGTISSSKNGRQ